MNSWRNTFNRRVYRRRLLGTLASIRHPSSVTTEPSVDLMRRVRIGFISQRTTFTEWCRQNGIHCPSARAAVIGTWNGNKGKAMRRRILRAARIGEAA